MTLSVMIIGGGRVGAALAGPLVDAGHTVVVVERDPERAERLAAAIPPTRVVAGDGTDPNALEAAGIRTADVLAAVTGDDACNLVVCGLARLEFGVPRTVARVVDPVHAWMFGEGSGVDVFVDQADLLTRLIVEEMSLGEVATLVKLRRGDLTLVEESVGTGSAAAGCAVGALTLPDACVLVAVIREDEVIASRADLVLEVGDEVLAVVHAGAAARLTELLAPSPAPGPELDA
jgi:trk system potassium uptake protein